MRGFKDWMLEEGIVLEDDSYPGFDNAVAELERDGLIDKDGKPTQIGIQKISELEKSGGISPDPDELQSSELKWRILMDLKEVDQALVGLETGTVSRPSFLSRVLSKFRSRG